MVVPAKLRMIPCALLLAACSSGPEVVAMDRVQKVAVMEGGLVAFPTPAAGCVPGRYIGSFGTSTAGDAGVSFAFAGEFTFSLATYRSGGGGEFTLLSDGAKLSGTSDTAQISFEATIESGGICREGQFDSRMTNGQYTILDSPKQPFEGTVHGSYNPPADQTFQPSFSGTWKINLLNIQGGWTALLVGKSPSP